MPNTPEPPIPFTTLAAQGQRLSGAIHAACAAVHGHGQYILGPECAQLEAELSTYLGGGTHSIGVSSGTDALVLALMALGAGPGCEVITTPYTWVSSASAIRLVGATPIFIDIEPDTFNLNADLLASALTPQTVGVLAVGIYGQCANMAAIEAFCAANNLWCIEDAAQSFGATQKIENSAQGTAQKSGTFGSISCTSFFPTKPLGGAGDGGACFTNNAALAEKLTRLRNHGQIDRNTFESLGMNGRLDTLQAAIILEKLKVFNEELTLRNFVAEAYTNAIENIPGLRAPVVAAGSTSAWAQYTVLVEGGAKTRAKLQAHLQAQGIPTAVYYANALYKQPIFPNYAGKTDAEYAEAFPVCEAVSAKCLSLPFGPYMEAAHQQRVIDALQAFEF